MSQKNNKGITINVDANTDKLKAKLDVMSKHMTALKGELYQIDGECGQEIKEEDSCKFLEITLDKYDSVPKVMYKGKEIKGRIRVLFDWNTSRECRHFPHIKIVHADKTEEEYPYVNVIEHMDCEDHE